MTSEQLKLICIALMLGFALFPRLTVAQSPIFLESRIARLEAENFQMRSQINRIESQLAQLNGLSTEPRQEAPTISKPSLNQRNSPSQSRTSRQISSSDPMFDRLATLVIELKERIQTLEVQVAKLNQGR